MENARLRECEIVNTGDFLKTGLLDYLTNSGSESEKGERVKGRVKMRKCEIVKTGDKAKDISPQRTQSKKK
jgi:hypothetical protein